MILVRIFLHQRENRLYRRLSIQLSLPINLSLIVYREKFALNNLVADSLSLWILTLKLSLQIGNTVFICIIFALLLILLSLFDNFLSNLSPFFIQIYSLQIWNWVLSFLVLQFIKWLLITKGLILDNFLGFDLHWFSRFCVTKILLNLIADIFQIYLIWHKVVVLFLVVPIVLSKLNNRICQLAFVVLLDTMPVAIDAGVFTGVIRLPFLRHYIFWTLLHLNNWFVKTKIMK